MTERLTDAEYRHWTHVLERHRRKRFEDYSRQDQAAILHFNEKMHEAGQVYMTCNDEWALTANARTRMNCSMFILKDDDEDTEGIVWPRGKHD